ncbi:hypothetical protein GCM10007103_19220 [Salinimicrobium marinum]|uniref:TonB-dependent receptor-like beta-barrel domain-containing protein n=1 Tax=Salinimicrobium marinum TaxID=680283 RepID=A0A918VYL4_9FLAO|nr:TonB-dependent receptor [Salinimicrobium marinum]GHA37830.1 hypothetical protein GCM10007103_19220 [Salinimicrobium marinum]
MKKILFTVVLFFLGIATTTAQEKEQVTTDSVSLKEIILIGKKQDVSGKEPKPLATLDEYLEKSSKVDMIKRGAYAWEPMINGMTTERSVITIDGMRIFSACTDKMDPVTSYVEISNLSEASISSGQMGAENGATIGGGIDLKRQKEGFTNRRWNGGLSAGGESNGGVKIAGFDLSYGNDSFYFNSDFMYRDAENYFAGGNEEVRYSQFTKYNYSGIAGFKISNHQAVEGSVILDRAIDVGYPALPMDVSLAQAAIVSLMYEHHQPVDFIEHWETKLYFNSIEHQMDDSERTNVPVRMDMPGWSDTYGYYSKAKTTLGNHGIKVNINGFYNKSLAEMTMYPNDPSEKEMFMFTWPNVRTLYSGIFLEDHISINEKYSLQLSGSLGSQMNEIHDPSGLQSLRIFYPEMEKSKARLLPGFNSRFQTDFRNWNFSAGVGYGERAPSVSEGYGFYLFNSFDGFDYIGNPNLAKEKSIELNAGAGMKRKEWKAEINGSYFHIMDYIIGKPDFTLSPMTIGANGIKVYEQLPYATIFHGDFSVSYKLLNNLNWNGKVIYNRGRSHNKEILPLVQPLSYFSSLEFRSGLFSMETSIDGAVEKTEFSREFGESGAPSYTVVNISASKVMYVHQQKLILKLGAENLFDAFYYTFSDWNNIPRKGRNLFINLKYFIQ